MADVLADIGEEAALDAFRGAGWDRYSKSIIHRILNFLLAPEAADGYPSLLGTPLDRIPDHCGCHTGVLKLSVFRTRSDRGAAAAAPLALAESGGWQGQGMRKSFTTFWGEAPKPEGTCPCPREGEAPFHVLFQAGLYEVPTRTLNQGCRA